MLCPYCKKQTPLYKKTCVNCGKEIPREMGDTLFTDGALESIESSLEQVAKTQSFAVDQVIAGKYLVKGLIGRGNFGIVYRCQDQETRKTVAIKTIYERLLPDDQTKQSLISYIEKTKDIDLPGISRVLNH